MPRLGLDRSMPLLLWQAVADAVRPTFADSYLARAVVVGRELWPKTTIAYLRLSRDPGAARAIKNLGYVLRRPDRNAGWKPVGDIEYDTMSIRDKIRHHEILAGKVMDDAWPLYRAHSRDLAELRKHEAWNALERAEAAHHAEAKRLHGLIANASAKPPPENDFHHDH